MWDAVHAEGTKLPYKISAALGLPEKDMEGFRICWVVVDLTTSRLLEIMIMIMS